MSEPKMNRRTAIKATAAPVPGAVISKEFLKAEEAAQPFGPDFPRLESLTTGEWWTRPGNNGKPAPKGRKGAPSMNVPRDQVVAFAIRTKRR